jgi:hypothetical protein
MYTLFVCVFSFIFYKHKKATHQMKNIGSWKGYCICIAALGLCVLKDLSLFVHLPSVLAISRMD